MSFSVNYCLYIAMLISQSKAAQILLNFIYKNIETFKAVSAGLPAGQTGVWPSVRKGFTSLMSVTGDFETL